MATIKTYPLTSTLNGKLNEEKFNLELRTSTISKLPNAYKFGQEIYVRFDEDSVSSADSTLLAQLISQHDGEEAETSEHLVNAREKKIRDLVQMAFYHPLLTKDETTAYLTTIDNEINAYKRGGVTTVIVARITKDSAVGQEYHEFLNRVVNEHGHKTFEFFIGMITS